MAAPPKDSPVTTEVLKALGFGRVWNYLVYGRHGRPFKLQELYGAWSLVGLSNQDYLAKYELPQLKTVAAVQAAMRLVDNLNEENA